jgi:hypothetical protein
VASRRDIQSQALGTASGQLQRVRLLRIAGQSGTLALAEMELPRVLVVREHPGAALTQFHIAWHKQVRGYPIAQLDVVANPLADRVAEDAMCWLASMASTRRGSGTCWTVARQKDNRATRDWCMGRDRLPGSKRVKPG